MYKLLIIADEVDENSRAGLILREILSCNKSIKANLSYTSATFRSLSQSPDELSVMATQFHGICILPDPWMTASENVLAEFKIKNPAIDVIWFSEYSLRDLNLPTSLVFGFRNFEMTSVDPGEERTQAIINFLKSVALRDAETLDSRKSADGDDFAAYALIDDSTGSSSMKLFHPAAIRLHTNKVYAEEFFLTCANQINDFLSAYYSAHNTNQLPDGLEIIPEIGESFRSLALVLAQKDHRIAELEREIERLCDRIDALTEQIEATARETEKDPERASRREIIREGFYRKIGAKLADGLTGGLSVVVIGGAGYALGTYGVPSLQSLQDALAALRATLVN